MAMTKEALMRHLLNATPSQLGRIEAVFKNPEKTTAKPTETRLVTIIGAARLLAIGRTTVYQLVRTGRLDTVEINGVRRITMKSVFEFLNGSRPATDATEALIRKSQRRYADDKFQSFPPQNQKES